MSAVALRFYDIDTPVNVLREYREKGGRGMRRFMARASDGQLIRVMFGTEPAGSNGQMLSHASVSVGQPFDTGIPPKRAPTDEEFMAAVSHAFGVLPWEEWPKPSATLARHAWTPESR